MKRFEKGSWRCIGDFGRTPVGWAGRLMSWMYPTFGNLVRMGVVRLGGVGVERDAWEVESGEGRYA